MRLENKVAIITGGSRGIGQATAELFAKEGATVYIWDLLDEGKDTAAGIVEKGGKAHFQKLSVTDKEAVHSAVAHIIEKESKIDILVNNAGITKDRSFLKMSDEEWDKVMDVNLRGVYLCTKAVAPHMKERKYGRLLFASSTTGLFGNYGQTNYGATKLALVGLVKSLTVELGPHGITSNCIAPGFTLTEMTKAIPDHIREAGIAQIPMRMIADPIDQAYGYLYLASDEARFVSGICLTIDGGVTRR